MSDKNWKNDKDLLRYVTIRDAQGNPVYTGTDIPEIDEEEFIEEGEDDYVATATGPEPEATSEE